jgi:hypothetical protein
MAVLGRVHVIKFKQKNLKQRFCLTPQDPTLIKFKQNNRKQLFRAAERPNRHKDGKQQVFGENTKWS